MKQIEVNGMIYEFDEKLLLKQEIRVGDNVQILIKDAHGKHLPSNKAHLQLPLPVYTASRCRGQRQTSCLRYAHCELLFLSLWRS